MINILICEIGLYKKFYENFKLSSNFEMIVEM
jgi:hypothetical protein